MDTAVKNKSFFLPKPMAELLPELRSILSKEAWQTFTGKKQPRSTIVQTRTSEKVIKPMTVAELRTVALALKILSPMRNPQPNTAHSKPRWNSSVKVEKPRNHTADGQLRHNSVRKKIFFLPKTEPVTNVRTTLISSETPKFPKPELRAKTSLHLQDKSNVRISGISNIPPTPVALNKITKPLETSKSNGDASFLLKEQEFNDIEERTRALGEESTSKVSPPASTPFKEYRNFEEFFNNTGDTERTFNDNTIRSFDKVVVSNESAIREQSVIVSLCDSLKKAAVTNTDTTHNELNDLLEVEKNLQHNIEMMIDIVELQLKSLQSIRKLINEKRNLKSDGNSNVTLNHVKIETPAQKEKISEKSSILRTSVIKIKSPSYKIPRKNMYLRKKLENSSKM